MKRNQMARFLKGENEGIRKEYLQQENDRIKAIQDRAKLNRPMRDNAYHILINGIVKGIK